MCIYLCINCTNSIEYSEILPAKNRALYFTLSDRIFEIDEATDALYHCALPLTDISDITSGMVTNAFTGISKMYGGGDSPEDVLLGRNE